MAKKKYMKIGNYTVFFDQVYYICYAGGKRELTEKQEDNWKRTLSLPGIARKKEQYKLGLDNNPDVVPVKGIDLISMIRELNFVPFFDRAFNNTHMLKLTDVVVFESIKQKNYELAMRK